MADCPRILVNLIVVPTLKTLIAEEVDVLVVDAREMFRWVCFGLDVLQAVRLIPAVREDVEGDLATD